MTMLEKLLLPEIRELIQDREIDTLREVLNRAGIRRPIRLTVASGLTSPVAIGRHEICLPQRVLAEMDPIQQESMLAHELAHLERRDSLWLLMARVIEAVFFFQPLNRLARRRMQDAAEFASDAFALQVLGKPVVLARCLARVAEWSVASPRLFAPAMSGRRGSMLVQRVERLTSGRAARERGPGRAGMALMGVAVLLLALVMPSAYDTVGPKLRCQLENLAHFVRCQFWKALRCQFGPFTAQALADLAPTSGSRKSLTSARRCCR